MSKTRIAAGTALSAVLLGTLAVAPAQALGDGFWSPADNLKASWGAPVMTVDNGDTGVVDEGDVVSFPLTISTNNGAINWTLDTQITFASGRVSLRLASGADSKSTSVLVTATAYDAANNQVAVPGTPGSWSSYVDDEFGPSRNDSGIFNVPSTTFTGVSPITSVSVVDEPTFTDACGTADDRWVTPANTGITWESFDAGPGLTGVRANPLDGYLVTGTREFAAAVTDEACPLPFTFTWGTPYLAPADDIDGDGVLDAGDVVSYPVAIAYTGEAWFFALELASVAAPDSIFLSEHIRDETITLRFAVDEDAAAANAIRPGDQALTYDYYARGAGSDLHGSYALTDAPEFRGAMVAAPAVEVPIALSWDEPVLYVDLNDNGLIDEGDKVRFSLRVSYALDDSTFDLYVDGPTLDPHGAWYVTLNEFDSSDGIAGFGVEASAADAVRGSVEMPALADVHWRYVADSATTTGDIAVPAAAAYSNPAVSQPAAFNPTEADLVSDIEGLAAVCDAEHNVLTTVTHGDEVFIGGANCSGVEGDIELTHVVAFSEPTVLGAGTLSVVIPQSLAVGTHRIALYGADNVIVGWQVVSVSAVVQAPAVEAIQTPAAEGDSDAADVVVAPISVDSAAAANETLSETGSESGPLLLVAATLALLGLVVTRQAMRLRRTN
ncbi:hypothetical protein [Demequina aurantiaca]|uniref:hypothetical protein n=1 Tax=Demequina aurantiaca TaxID=676200 RepID=UPI003D354CEF